MPGRFLEGERVHVGAEEQARAAAASGVGIEARAADTLSRVEAESRQTLADDIGRAELLERQLGMGVEVAARGRETRELRFPELREQILDARREGTHARDYRGGHPARPTIRAILAIPAIPGGAAIRSTP
jgi:hypothetical protein